MDSYFCIIIKGGNSMSVNLQKGQKISLVKPGEPGLKRIMVGLGWDEVEQKRGWFAPKPQDIDCDVKRRTEMFSCIISDS